MVVVENESVTFNVLGTATDPDGDPLMLAGFSQPAHGAVSCTPSGVCTYTPTAGYSGADSFTYRISDGSGAVATFALRASAGPTADGTVNITVTAAPQQSTTTTTTTPIGDPGPVTTPASTAVPGSPEPVDLPETGGDVLPVLVCGLATLAVGIILVRRGRRRRATGANSTG